VFDEFFQVDELASTRYRGAGLGLALVRDLIKLLDGSIELSSEVGSGTRVVFRGARAGPLLTPPAPYSSPASG
jgi:two-component system, sensor histidine kinase